MRWKQLSFILFALLVAWGCDRREILDLESSRTGCPEKNITVSKGCENRYYTVSNGCNKHTSYYSCATILPTVSRKGIRGELALSECLRGVPGCAAKGKSKAGK